ncbi:unnamed protein product [Kuraishia capsulata CBS 1993]|uniref:WSC domain-containing protein n=1 Tax=Kuraishia capsulata CBS 1993 TaxID=1382522 RepID=W6MXG6_9ASCO|nr:uncharacterized protein KUCA_T00004840001 [Kuraishia capsulata CBS 1993]CDK28855.1 unnamed protein product [Kuraishia capsulata CBS 1993]
MVTRFSIGVLVVLLAARVNGAYTLLGCYDSLPSSYDNKGTAIAQSSLKCYGSCSGYSYFATSDGDECYCGDTAPSGNTSDDCTVSCYGYPGEMCGGSSAYSFYSMDDNDDNSSSSVSSTESSSSETSTKTSTASQTSSSSTSSSTSSTPTSSSSTDTSSGTPVTTTSESTSSSQNVSKITSTVSQSTGGYRTSVIYITHTASSSPSASTNSSSSKANKKSSNAAVIGGAVGGAVGGLAILGLVVFLCCFRRHRKTAQSGFNSNDSSVVDDLAYEEALKVDNPFADEFRMTDQRLNPVMLDRRRMSEGSLADAADYSRKILRVANPDDED